MIIWRILVAPLALVFWLLVSLKNWLYDRRLLAIKRLDRPVISVGNLSMGGAGKSPTVSGLIDLLEAQGYRVGVLSRGYGRKDPKATLVVDPAGHWQDFGDEPLMLARRHGQAMVMVGPSRFVAAQAGPKPDVYVVDDGFQHRQLHRDLDVVLIDLSQGFPLPFPMKTFREGFAALKRADMVILTRWDGQLDLKPWLARIENAAPGMPVAVTRFVHDTLVDAQTGRVFAAKELGSNRVAAYCGLANGSKFFDSLAALGLDVVIKKALPDHGVLESSELNKLLQEMRQQGVTTLVSTEKDLVKLDKGSKFDILLCSLSMKIDWGENEQIHAVLECVMKADS